MIGTLYRIFHIKSGKSYIGKTYKDLYTRLSEHIRASTGKHRNRPLYRAFNKYGLDNFSVEVLGEYSEELLENKEIETIEQFSSYGSNGYNATLGGDGRPRLKPSEEEVLKAFDTYKGIKETSKILKTDHKRVSAILKNNSINTKTEEVPVLIKELNIKFSSVTKAAEYLISNSFTTNQYARNKIYDVLAGKRKTYLGYSFIRV